MATLKRSSDGLSKSWAVNGSVKPFFSGGRIEVSDSPSKLYCVNDGALSSLDLISSSISTNILGSSVDVDDELRDGITCFCVHPNGEELVVATASYLIKHYNIKTGALLRTIKGNYNMPILSLAYDATGTLVATGSADSVVRVWDITKGYCTHTFRAHTDIVPLVTFVSWSADVGSPADRLLLASCSDDRTIILHDLQTSKTITTFRQHMGAPTDVALNNRFAGSKSSTLLMASCGRDRVLNIFDMRTHKHIKTVPVADEELEAVAFVSGADLPAKRGGRAESFRLVSGGSAGLLKVYFLAVEAGDVSCQQALQLDTQQGCMLTNLVYVPQEHKLVAATSEQCFHFFSVLDGDSSVGNAVDYDNVQIDGNLDDILDVLMLTGDCTQQDATAEESRPTSAYKLAVITNTSNLRIMNSSFQTMQHLSGHEDTIMALDCNNDCKLIVTGSKDNSCRLWLWQEDQCQFVCCGAAKGHTGAVGAVCIAQRQATYLSKQAFVVSGSVDRSLKRWVLNLDAIEKTMASGEDMPLDFLLNSHSTRAHEKDVNTVASAPNDSMVASGSQDRSIKLWNSADLTPIATLSGHKRGVWKVVFSPIDRCLLSASADRTLRLWSLQDFSCIRTFQGHTSSVLCAKFINRGMQILSGGADGVLKVWTIRSGECENSFDDEHTDRVWCIAAPRTEPAAAGDRFCVTGSSDGSLRRWVDTTSAQEEQQLQEEEQRFLVEQELHNDLRNKKYDKALAAALELNHSRKVYNIFAAILADSAGSKAQEDASDGNTYADVEQCRMEDVAITSRWSSTLLLNQMAAGNGNGNADLPASVSVRDSCKQLDKYVCKLSKADLHKILSLISEWNTNAKYAHVCHVLLDSILRNVNLSVYIPSGDREANASAKDGGDEDTVALRRLLPQVLPGLVAYSERHYQRLNKLNQASYMIDHMCSSMNAYAQINLALHNTPSESTTMTASTTTSGSKRILSTSWTSDDALTLLPMESDEEPLVVFKKSRKNRKSTNLQ